MSMGEASALSFGTTTAALSTSPGLVTAALGSLCEPGRGIAVGRRWRELVMLRAALQTEHQPRAQNLGETSRVHLAIALQLGFIGYAAMPAHNLVLLLTCGYMKRMGELLIEADLACFGSGHGVLGLNDPIGSAGLLRCPLSYASRKILHAHLLPGLICNCLQIDAATCQRQFVSGL